MISLYINDPIKQRQNQESESAGKHDKGARPESFVDREVLVPKKSDEYTGRSYNYKIECFFVFCGFRTNNISGDGTENSDAKRWKLC